MPQAPPAGEDGIAFGPYRLDRRARSLSRDGISVPLGGRAFDLLATLAAAQGAVVDKDTIFDRVWPGLAVEENNIQVQVSTLRKTLGEAWIQTVPGRGYRLNAPAVPAPAPGPAAGPPTLVVLPFVDLSGAPEEGYFADALTEEITTALSRVRWFHVIARSSAFAYKGQAGIDVRQVGRDLGARYVLEGSVRRAGSRIRMSGSLIDAETGLRLWADRFEGDASDVFALQDRLAEAVTGAIEPSLRNAEIGRARARPTGRLDAYDLYLRSLPLIWEGSRESYARAVVLLKRAVAMDPDYAVAKAFLAFALMNCAGHGWASAEDRALGAQMADEALAGGGDDCDVLRLGGQVLAYLRREHDRGLAAVQRALALNPNAIGTLMSAGWVHCYRLEPAPAVELFERALRLNPLHMELGYLLSGLGLAHLIAGDPARALPMLERAVIEMPNWAPGVEFLVAALQETGRAAAARTWAARAMAQVPRLRARPEKWVFPPGPFLDGFLAALRDAGVPG